MVSPAYMKLSASTTPSLRESYSCRSTPPARARSSASPISGAAGDGVPSGTKYEDIGRDRVTGPTTSLE